MPSISPLTGADAAAHQVLVDHQRMDAGSCTCGWGVNTGHLGRSHAVHIVEQMHEAGISLRFEPRTFRTIEEMRADGATLDDTGRC